MILHVAVCCIGVCVQYNSVCVCVCVVCVVCVWCAVEYEYDG